MLTDITLQGFKSFIEDTIDLNQLTVLTGLNSSGKSSVIQAIRMVDRMCRKKSALLPEYGEWSELENKDYGGEPLIEVNDSDGRCFKCGEFKKEAGNPLDSGFPKVIYISASRFGPQVNIPMYADDTDIDSKGGNVVKNIDTFINGDNVLPEILRPDEGEGFTYEYILQTWINKISPNMKFRYETNAKADVSYTTFNGYRSKNVGFGLSFTLPVIAALLESVITPNCIVIIENPEAHLHAKAQTEIADLIGRCVDAGAQVIIETHSDHLFDGLRIYAKEHPGFADKMNCYWFELNKDLHTESTFIEIGENGKIASLSTPPDFFNQFEINTHTLIFGR